ncbi:Hypothetical protein SRAE_0000070800 [Strongyloides ratti]|uniref:Uncharacterized protein n=1 Tax=Strongyloides ratti TaxID=34506 RepID=A0A090KVR1_STRRB|nr:Hypothetical protein SRAE_0000070800 [Strongyloides ratti]CEF61590.2 Hypothetical protein SRAE_0000070800 [Strongyloides ratti]
MQLRCPKCFNHNNPENSLKIPISNFESHFSLYHYNFEQLKHFLTDTIAPLKSQETINAKCGLLEISCENIIKDDKKSIQNLDITDENEIIVPKDDINNESIRKDRKFFY